MKANNLSISIPNYGCNKNCPYCISKMTGYNIPNRTLMYRNTMKVLNISQRSDVNSLSFTSKGEILSTEKSIQVLQNLLLTYTNYFSCELQTNGISLNKKLIDELFQKGIDTIAISIDRFNDIQEFHKVFEYIKSYGITLRLTINLVNDTYLYPVSSYIQQCKNFEIDQISFRKITIPNHKFPANKKSLNTKKWIEKNISIDEQEEFLNDFNLTIFQKGQKVRNLPYGAIIYDLDGISVTYFDYCIQDENGDDDIRSLIFHEDGHLSTSWYGSNVGRIL